MSPRLTDWLTLPRPSTEELTRFFSRLDVAPSGCWLWTGSRNGKGYGSYEGNSAHRFTYTWFVGPIPVGLEIDHLCRVTRCVNPAHGEAVTGIENRWRANRFETTGRCRRGHVLADVGIARNHVPGLDRTCRACRRISQARYVVRNGLPLGDELATALAQERMRLAMLAARESRTERAS